MDIAFALGGLGGNNAHGAGFLQAALNARRDGGPPGSLRPRMISCTSGQLLWVHRYLQALERRGDGGRDDTLRAQFAQDLEQVRPTGQVDLDFALLALGGKKGVFRPVNAAQWWADVLRNGAQAVHEAVEAPGRTSTFAAWLSLVPSRLAVPQFGDAFYEGIAQTFRAVRDIGIAFNSYNPQTGQEHVYLNDAARALLKENRPEPEAFEPGQSSKARPYRVYQDVDAEGVRDALWLYAYGFDDRASGFLDGAYFRGTMLSEVARADLVFSVRPLHHQWQGPLPRNYPGVEDLKTEVSFNGAYSAERNQVLLVNKLLADGAFTAEARRRYREVQLEEIEVDMQRGYLDYLLESMEVFEAAERKGEQAFARRVSTTRTPKRLRSVG